MKEVLSLRSTQDLKNSRDDFPIFKERPYDKPFVFLDSAASSQKPQSVLDAERSCYEHYYANVHRGVYQFSVKATDQFEEARATVARFIGAASSKSIIFVRGATEGINLVASSYGRSQLKAGDEIILSHMEHHSNIVPWQLLRDQIGVVLKIIPMKPSGELDLDTYHHLFSDKTKFVALTHVSNALGTINPVKEMIAYAHGKGAKVLIDGCQAVPHLKVNMTDLDADFYVFSAHKCYGPTGIGALYGKEALLEAMPPYHGGGDMILSVSFEKTTYNTIPYKFEAGTPAIAQAIGFAEALRYLEQLGMDKVEAHDKELLAYATEKLTKLDGFRMIGEAKEKTAILSFLYRNVHPHDIGTILDREGIAVRAGHHCAQPVMDYYGISATTRASLGIYNVKDDIDALVHGLEKVKQLFG